MLKYTTAQVAFREIPDEIVLCINISGCPIHCPKCHSKELWQDIGEELTRSTLLKLIDENKGISCVCFMGGDNDIEYLVDLAWLIKDRFGSTIKVAWYSGGSKIYNCSYFDYVKIGPYIEERGGLDNINTNQRLFKSNYSETQDGNFWYWEDITYKLQNATPVK